MKSTLPLSLLLLLAFTACEDAGEARRPQPRDLARASAPLFVNGGFETGSLLPDWTTSTFLYPANITNPPWPPVSDTQLNLAAGGVDRTRVVTDVAPESQLFAGMIAEPGVPRWPKFGTNSVVVNELGAARNVNSIKQAYTTTSADVEPADGKVHVRFVLAPALQAAGHRQEQQPYFFVALRNLAAPRNGDLHTSFNFSNSPGTPWRTQGTGATAVLYTDWTIFDIAPGNVALQVGDTVEIEVYAAGCQPSAHWGEVYVDGFGASFPGLSVSKSAPAQTNLDTDITYDFLVKNNTSFLVPNVSVDEVIPADTTFVSLNAPGATCTTPAVGGTGTVTCNFGWMNAGASATFQVTVHAYAPATGGQASAATVNTLTDGPKAWTPNAWRGWSVYVTSGTGAGQERVIGGNTANQLTVSNNWTTTPDATSTYGVINAPSTQGTATGGNAARLDDTTKAWAPNAWSGWTVYIVAGTGAGQQRNITTNSATRLNIAPNWAISPNATSVYAVKQAPKVTNGDYGIAADTVARMLGPRVETAITAGVPFADLAITKTDGVPGVVWNGATTYTISVVNNGPLPVTNALVTDTFPAQLVANPPWTCTGTGGGTCNTAAGTGNISHTVNLPVGATATFTVNATVVNGAGNGTLSNTATVAPPAGTTDNDPGNNADIDIDGIGTLYALTVSKGAGETGQGTVTSAPAAIDCGPACAAASADFLDGTSVTLTAVARPGDTFTGWTGACGGVSMTCTVTVTGALTAIAHFKGLDVIGSAPGGNGTVTCVPAEVAQGASSICAIAPDVGYGITLVTDNGVDVTASVAGYAYALTNITVSHTVVATFGALPLTPVLTAPADGSTTGDATPTFTGTSSPAVDVELRVDGVVVCTAVTDGAGAFTCTPAAPLPDGPHVATASASNANGSTPESAPVRFTVDTLAPLTPVVVGPANGSRTSDTTPTVTGTGEPGATVTVSIDGAPIAGAPVVAADGTWSLAVPVALAAGAHTVSAIAVDGAGNTSLPSNTNTFTVDTTPGAPVMVAPADAQVVTTATPALSGTAPAGSAVTVSVDGLVACTAIASGAGAFSCTPAALAAGPHAVFASVPDGGGGALQSNTNTFTVDTANPAAPVVTSPADGSTTTNPAPTVTGTAEALSTVTVFFDGVSQGTTTASVSGDWTFPAPTALSLGAHTVSAQATDRAGRSSAVSAVNNFTVAAAALTSVLLTPPDGSITNDPTPLMSGTAAPGLQLEARVDGLVVCTATASASGAWSCTPGAALAQGAHAATANIVGDAARSNTNVFTVDSVVPAVPVVLAPANGSTAGPTPALSGTAEPGALVTASVDGVAVCAVAADALGNWSCVPAIVLAAGPHTVSATATDNAGSTSAPSVPNTFTVDATVPAAPVVATPANGSIINDSTPAITGTAEANSTVSVYIDGILAGTTAASGAGAWSFTSPALSQASHTARATATDAAGNVSANSNTNTFTVDTTAPSAPVVVAPANGSSGSDTTPDITGTAEAGSTVSVYIDGVLAGTTTADGTGAWSFTSPALSQASHTARATASDAAGNVSASSNTNSFTVDTTAPAAPVVVAPANGSSTNDTTPVISGTAEADSTVSVYVDGVLAGTTVASGAGAWSFTSAALSQASHTARATATDAAGNVSADSNTNTFTVDTAAPAAPVVVAPADGSFTSDTTPDITGTAEANSTVSVYIDGVLAGTAVADGTGAWSFTSAALTQASHTARATATDAAGNVSASSNTNTFIVDTTAPAAPVVLAPANGSAINDSTPAITGTAEANSTVSVYIDGVLAGTATADGAGAWSFTSAALTQASHSVRATATDPAGNVSADSNTNTFTVDTDAPTAPVVVAPADGSSGSDPTPAITGTAEAGSTVSVYLDGALAGTTIATAAGTFSFTAPLTLSDGSHTARATSTDAAGNVSTDSNTSTFTVDTAAPAAPVVLAPADGASTTPLPTVSGTAEANSTVTVFLDGVAAGTVTANASGDWSFTATVPLTGGAHTTSATAQDAAGNTSGASNANGFTVLTAVPAAPALTSPAEGSATSDTTPALSGTAEPFSTVTVTVDGQVVCTTTATAAGTFSCAPATALGPGVHLATAAASNVMGSSPESAPVQFRIDSAAPLTPVVVGPADGSHTGPTPTVTGTGEPGSTVTVRIDGSSIGTAVVLGNGTWSLAVPSSLAAGAHTASATAVDAAGNPSLPSNTNTFTVDTIAGAPVVTAPADNSFVSTASPALSGTAPAGSEVTVRVDGIVACLATADSTGAFSCSAAAPLADGPHTVDATVPDGAGGTLPSNTNAFTVDTALPAAPVVLIPVDGSSTTDTTPIISGTAEPFSTVAVSIDGAQVGTTFADAGGSWALTAPSALSLGAHTASALSTDRAGNDSPVSAVNAFTVVAAGSAAVVLAPPDGSLTNDATPALAGSATPGATVEARIDGAIVCTVVAGPSGTWSCTPATALSEGTHVATATLVGFSETSNANSFTVDTLAPAAPVVQSPASGGTAGATPTVSGTAEANATVTVSIDGAAVCVTSADAQGRWSCTPGAALAAGPHTVSATATDAAGNASAQSPANGFTVDSTPPAPPVLSAPADGSSTSQTTPQFQGTSAPGATVTVSVDGQPVCEAQADGAGAFACTPAVALTVGVHSAWATARSGSGSPSAPSNTNTFTVDTSSPAAPVVLAPADGSSTNSTTPAITGTAEANSTVSVYLDGALAGTAAADGSGSFSFTPAALAPGSHTVSATSSDAAGNTSAPSATNTFTIDTAAPPAPVVISPSDGSSTGTLPIVSGTAEAGSTVTVTLDGAVAGTATADASGAWTFTPTAPLSGGSHTVSATSRDGAGNTSAPSATNTFTVLVAPPPAPALTSPSAGSSTQDTTPDFSGTAAAGATVTVTVDGQVVCTTTATSAGVFSCTPATALGEGAHVATAAAANLAGSSAESAPVQFRIDTIAPLTPFVVGPADGSRTGATPTVTGTGEPGSTVTVRIDGASIGTATVQGDGTWSLVVPAALSSGSHTVFATATDAAGNASLPSNTNTFTVDLSAGAPVVSAPADNSFVSTATPLVEGTAPAGSTVTVSVDGVVACVATASTTGAFSCTPATPLAEGSHAVSATIPDGLGGTLGSNTNTFTVDLAAPGAPVVVAPADGSATSDPTPTISGTAEPYTTVLVFIDGAQVGTATADAGGAWSLDTPTALTSGTHTASAQARDRAGNLSASSAVNTFTVGTASGVPVVLTPPDGSLTNDATPAISGTAAPGAAIEARVDGAVVCTATASVTGAWSCTPTVPLTEGAHAATANVVGVSATSNANSFTVDSAAPPAPVVEQPANGSRTGATPPISGTAEANSRVTVSIDGTPVCVTAADAQGRWSCTPGTPLSVGSHTVSATATDAAGNTSLPSTPNTFTVDTTAPGAPVLSTPADGSSTDQSRPPFTGTAEPHSQVTVLVDGQPVCTALADDLGAFGCTPAVALTVGLHSARAVARDEAGNSSPPSNTNGFTITPGAPTISTPASGSLTNDATPAFTGTAPPGSTVAVSEGTNLLCTAVADAMGAWSCTPASALSEGGHEVTATATVNSASSPASAPTSFTIDTVPPQVTIGGGPGDQTTETTASFDVSSNEPNVGFECSLDGAAFVPCPSPAEFSGLAAGPHALEVRGTDAAGNNATARREWLVTSAPPPVGAFAGGGCGCGSVEGGALSLLALLVAALRWRRRRSQ